MESLSFDVPDFAEVIIDPDIRSKATNENIGGAGHTPAQTVFTTVSPPQQIMPRVIDPIREKFYEMRRLSHDKPFARNDSELFYRQAVFMEDFTDDFEGNAKFNMYYPYYQNMGYEYLRTYFSWRTKARQGEICPISLSYVFLYIYELLSGIGFADPADGLARLLAIWNVFSDTNPALEKYMPGWLKDYYVFYELGHSFSDFVEAHHLQKYYSLTLLFDEKTENKLWISNALSSYNVANSKFYKDGNEQLFGDCFDKVLYEIHELCRRHDARLQDLFVYTVSRRLPWQPFKQALFGSRVKQTDREIKLSEFECYYCKNGKWTATLPIYYSSQRDFIGYILKKTEACLRRVTDYKFKLAVDIKPGSKSFRELARPAIKRTELDKVIEKTVADFHRSSIRTVVTVDLENLARIREEALGTQEQLIVPEAETLAATEADMTSSSPQASDNNSAASTVQVHKNVTTTSTVQVHENDTTSSAVQVRENDAMTSAVQICENDTASPTIKPAAKTQPEPELTMSFADGWKALKASLTDIERKALSIALIAQQPGADTSPQGSTSVKTFADENGIMLEVLADGINEKAADCIGDSILEVGDEIILYDEYRENIEAMVR